MHEVPQPGDADDDLPALLLLVDGLVRRDGPASGLSGEVCLGVRGSAGYTWWRGRFGRRFSCGFVPAVSSTAHATLCLAEADAQALLRTGRLPETPELFTVDGDAELLSRFLKRYTSRTGWVGIRLTR